MKNRDEKREDFDDLKKRIDENPTIFVAGFERLTVSQDYELRKLIRGAGGNYKVIKNNVAEKAAEGTRAEPLMTGLKGMTSMVYTTNDPVALAKALTRYAKDNSQFTFKAGIVEGRVIDLQAITDLANMPPKEEIYAKLLFLIQASAQRLVTAVAGVGRNLAVVIDQGVKENKFQQLS
jgi:large subunit ribosomal protein L10